MDGRQLEAGAAEVGDHAVERGQILEGRHRTQAGLLGGAQHAHLDPVLAAQRLQEAVAMLGLPHGGRGHVIRGGHASSASSRSSRTSRRNRRTARRVSSTAAGGRVPGRPHGIGSEVQEGHQLGHAQSCQAARPPVRPAWFPMIVMSGSSSRVMRLALPPPRYR